MASSVNAGANEVKRANFGSKMEQWKAMHESGCSVATFQRHDAPTSRRWVNHCKSQQAVTSRRLNVVTSQRHDVSARSALHHLKAPRVQNSGYRDAYGLGHGIPEQQRHRSRRRARDLYRFPFLDNRMMFKILNIDIFLFRMF